MNLVLIVLDSLRQDHVARYGKPAWYDSPIQTPKLDAFAGEAGHRPTSAVGFRRTGFDRAARLAGEICPTEDDLPRATAFKQ
ncbi:MAG TPA: hypothetical protein VMZ31_15000 [Phycisphaerae bacterium]|nr:hypothetical protein [Phycisphaerae bacterium]